jgi:hypothetical protein
MAIQIEGGLERLEGMSVVWGPIGFVEREVYRKPMRKS